MTDQPQLASQIMIKIGGTDVQEAVMNKLASLSVDQNSHLPGMFTVQFNDPGLELLDSGPFDLTKEIEILAQKDDGTSISLIKGEITALEPQYGEGMISDLVIRGFDKSHRLFRETKSRAFLNIKDSDIANQVAGAAGLSPQVDTTDTVYDHLFQHNQSDLAFLFQRAWRIGYECFVEDGKLYFRKPPSGGESATLRWGEELISFRPRLSLAEQVDEVFVRGWDAEQKAAIVGQASTGQLYPQTSEKTGAQWASSFGKGKLVIVDLPVISQAEANAVAKARLDELSGTFIEAEGVAFRRPDIKAGKIIKIEALGTRLSGKYLVTGATHTFAPEGLKTVFSVRGSHTGMVSEQMDRREPLDHFYGVVPALVTNVQDPNDWNRVKLKFPWMTEDAESDWARVIGAGAGPEAGFCVLPAVGDEVLVSFMHGDFDFPIVLGGLWNGQAKIPPPTVSESAADRPLVRTWHSIDGHYIVMDDKNKKIEIVSTGGIKVTVSDQDKKVTIANSQSTVVMEESKIAVESSSELTIKSKGNLKLDASGNIDINATGQVTIKGQLINLN